MNSQLLATVSALLLGASGAALLFGADALLPALVTGYPRGGAWLGQLVGAAWLALSAITWLTRSSVQGGIYGRPIVLANVTVYFISAMVLLKSAARADSPSLWIAAAAAGGMALAYLWLMFGGPPERVASAPEQA